MTHVSTETRKVRIHIDRAPYESSEHTTGEALYRLGNVPHNRELFKEMQGNVEDQLIKRNDDPITVYQDEHFYSEKEVTIVVEGTPHAWLKGKISYAEVVTLEVPDYPQHPDNSYSVKYKNGPAHKPVGILAPGASVKVKKGMVFSVSETGQS